MADDRHPRQDNRRPFHPDQLERPNWEDRPDWGGVARRGAFRVDPDRRFRADRRLEERRANDRVKPDADEVEGATADDAPGDTDDEGAAEEWILESVEPSRRRGRGAAATSDAGDPVGRSGTGAKLRDVGSVAVGARVDTSQVRFGEVVSNERARRLRGRLDEAATAFSRERFGDAVSILRPMSQETPGVAEVRELLGLAYYRQGRWRDAYRELRAFNEIAGSTEQHPVLADCARALGRNRQVEVYWDALRQSDADPDVEAEGRIVMAGSLADRGRLADAMRLLQDALDETSLEERDLRTRYVLADLHERAGDLPAARSGFAWLDANAPGFGDVGDRRNALG